MAKKRKPAPRYVDKDLIARIEKCIATTGTNMTAFGREAIKDHRLVPDLKAGRELRRATLERIERAIAARYATLTKTAAKAASKDSQQF